VEEPTAIFVLKVEYDVKCEGKEINEAPCGMYVHIQSALSISVLGSPVSSDFTVRAK
jgi:hypothetical protein